MLTLPLRPNHDVHRGIRAAGALLPAIVPLGVALGVALGETASSRLVAWLSAPLLVAGASQLALFGQLDHGTAVVAAALAAIVLNARFVVYGAALAARFGGQPGWFRWLGPHYIVDQTFAMVVAEVDDNASNDQFRRFFAAAGTLLWFAWTCSVGIGLLAGPVIPSHLPLEMVLPATFVALIVPGLTRRSEILAAVVGGAVGAGTLGSTSALAFAALIGAVIGVGQHSGCTS
jgi:predicted branched-subunit amino acid permease